MIVKEIAIPADNDGFALLQCNLCGEFFKLKPSDVQSDEVLNIWCPVCGLISDGYFTQDVIDLALKMYDSKEYSIRQILDASKLSKTTFYRYLNKRNA